MCTCHAAGLAAQPGGAVTAVQEGSGGIRQELPNRADANITQ